MGHWRVHLLGTERMAAADGQAIALPDIGWPLIGSLLGAASRSATRGWIANELWPDSPDDESARHRLGTALWRLGKRVPPAAGLLRIEGERIALAPAPTLWIDAIAFERRARAALSDPPTLGSSCARHRLRRALALYQGDLLGARDHEAIVLERERLRGLFIDASFALACAEAKARNWTAALHAARRLCAVEPLREDAQRLVIRACLETGDRAQAHKQYRAFARLLDEELGVAPMAETQALLTGSVAAFAIPAGAADPGSPGLRASLVDIRERISRVIELIDSAA